MANLLVYPKNKKYFFCFWGPYNVKSGNPGVVGDVIAADFLSSRILGVGRIGMEIMFLIWYWRFNGKVNFYYVNSKFGTAPQVFVAGVVFLQLRGTRELGDCLGNWLLMIYIYIY